MADHRAVAPAPGAAARAVAPAPGAAAAAARGQGSRTSKAHHFFNSHPNTNRINSNEENQDLWNKLYRRYKSHDNEDANVENLKLIASYKSAAEIGKSYRSHMMTGKGKVEMKELMHRFHDLVKKISRKEAQIRTMGANPVPLPQFVLDELPETMKATILAGNTPTHQA